MKAVTVEVTAMAMVVTTAIAMSEAKSTPSACTRTLFRSRSHACTKGHAAARDHAGARTQSSYARTRANAHSKLELC
eukprot:431736-Pleurochrysis_carterae.AAC.3